MEEAQQIMQEMKNDIMKSKENFSNIAAALKKAYEKAQNKDLKNFIASEMNKLTLKFNNIKKVDIIIKESTQQPEAGAIPRPEWGADKIAGSKEIVSSFVSKYASMDENKINGFVAFYKTKRNEDITSCLREINKNYREIVHKTLNMNDFSKKDIEYILERMKSMSDLLLLMTRMVEKSIHPIYSRDEGKIKEFKILFVSLKKIVDSSYAKLTQLIV